MRFLKILIILCAVSCNKAPSPTPPQKSLVLVSIAPYKFLAERIGGDAFEVRSVVPLQANPHIFEPTSKQVGEISRGVVWFRVGEPFEKKILSLFTRNNHSLVISDLREKIPLLEGSCCIDGDRHIWLSPKLLMIQAEEMEKVLSKQFPEKEAIFKQNFSLLRQELEDLDTEIRQILEPVKERILLVSHPAFGYFCRDYGIEQLSIEYEEKDPRPKHLEEVLHQAVDHHAEFALAVPQHNNQGAQLIAKKLHIPVHWIDPYSEDYFQTMRTLTHFIANSRESGP